MTPTIEPHDGKIHVAAHLDHEGEGHHARAIHIAEAFAAGLTDLPVTLTVTDEEGRTWSVGSPGGALLQPVNDTEAFAVTA